MPVPSSLTVGDALERATPPTNVSLFLYNAAVWNAHRIHYDEPTRPGSNTIPGIVIDGPLQGDWLTQVVLELARRGRHAARVRVQQPPRSLSRRNPDFRWTHHRHRRCGNRHRTVDPHAHAVMQRQRPAEVVRADRAACAAPRASRRPRSPGRASVSGRPARYNRRSAVAAAALQSRHARRQAFEHLLAVRPVAQRGKTTEPSIGCGSRSDRRAEVAPQPGPRGGTRAASSMKPCLRVAELRPGSRLTLQ
jgi:hypothetical protein